MASKSPVHPPSSVSGHDLWVLPPPAFSQWFSRIDWYLNWQMSKGLTHQPQKPSVELFRILEETGFQLPADPAIPSPPLMVASAGKVGSERCVVINYQAELKPWLATVHRLCMDLQSKRTRVFLPHGADLAEAQNLWKKMTPLETQPEFSTDEETTV